jgi:hypothetical protein
MSTPFPENVDPIIRTGAGSFFGFGEPDSRAMSEMQGRFAQLLPGKAPSPEHSALAQAMLKVKGVTPIKPNSTPSLSPARRGGV